MYNSMVHLSFYCPGFYRSQQRLIDIDRYIDGYIYKYYTYFIVT